MATDRPPLERESIARLADLAAEQQGYVTVEQASELRVSTSEIEALQDAAVLTEVGTGICRFAGVPVHRMEDLWISWMRLKPGRHTANRARRPDMWVSGWSAARVWDLGVVIADRHTFVATQPGKYQAAAARLDDVEHLQEAVDLTRDDWAVRHGVPVLRPHRIIADLVIAPGSGDGGHLGRLIDDALAEGAVRDDALAAVVEERVRPLQFCGIPFTEGTELIAYLLSQSAK